MTDTLRPRGSPLPPDAETGGTPERILVAVASKHGATAEIAKVIAEVLADAGYEVDLRDVTAGLAVDDYDAIVLGSAVYAGHWMKDARRFVELNEASLIVKPVWLFSSGPIGEPPKPAEDPVDIADLFRTITAREHVVFSGKLDRAELGFGEKAIVTALRTPDGDFRDWDAIRHFAVGIATELDAAKL